MHKHLLLLIATLSFTVTGSHANPPVKASHVVDAPTVVDIYDGGSPALPLETQNMWLEKAQDFMNGINTLKAKFVQVTSHPNGVMDSRTGMIKWMRPGYIRFDYDGLPFLQVAADGESFRQKDEDGISMSVSIDSTPAGLILKNNLNFRKDAVVKQVLDKDAFVLITLTSKDDPEGAALTLIFKKAPFFLAQWTTVDTTHRIIDVVLMDVQIGLSVKKGEFKLD